MHRTPRLRLWPRHLVTPLFLLLPFLLLMVHFSRSPNSGLADDFHPLVVHSLPRTVDSHPVNRDWHQKAARRLEVEVKAHRKKVRQQHARAVLRAVQPTHHHVYIPPPARSVSGAQQAVAFAYAQLGCPYVWGGTGPCSSGFDCSGLVMEAWASAGVQIPRTALAQWLGLPHISMGALEPGDLVIFAGGSHVGMYVGGGMLIDSPQPGESVEKIPLDTPWYQENLVGAVRP